MQKQPSVLFINRVYPPDRGATGRVLRDLARGFSRDGWKVTVLTTGEETRTEKDGDIMVRRLGAPAVKKTIISYAATGLKLMAAALRMPRHDLVVTMTDPPLLVVAGAIVAKRRKSRHIHWCQDVYPELLPVLGYELPESVTSLLAKVTRHAMKKCDRVIVIGRCMARGLMHRGLDSRLLTVIPNWPDPELAKDRPSSESAGHMQVTRPMNVKPPESLFRDSCDMKFRVLYAGTLGRAHPVETVLGAAHILQQSHPDIEFVFVGNGPQFERLAAERARRRLENIRLLPWQPADRLRQLMDSGDVHLITMRHEAAGLLVPCKIYAAMAARRPAILVGPEHGEAARLLLDFNAGTVVPQGEPAQLAEAVCRYREDSGVWFAAQEGARRAGEIFLPEESIRAWIERARSVLGPEFVLAQSAREPMPANDVTVEQSGDVRNDRAA